MSAKTKTVLLSVLTYSNRRFLRSVVLSIAILAAALLLACGLASGKPSTSAPEGFNNPDELLIACGELSEAISDWERAELRTKIQEQDDDIVQGRKSWEEATAELEQIQGEAGRMKDELDADCAERAEELRQSLAGSSAPSATPPDNQPVTAGTQAHATAPVTPDQAQTTAKEQATETRAETSNQPPGTSYTRLDAIPEGETAQPDQWYYQEETTEEHHIKFVMMTASDVGWLTTYSCVTTAAGQTVPRLKVRYPQPLPAELITRKNALPIETTVGEEVLDVEWAIAITRDTDIRLRGADAQRLVQTLIARDADGYHLAVIGVPETGHFVDAEGLGDVLAEAGVDCLLSEIKELDAPDLSLPATLQEPQNGLYTYTSPDGHFTFQYPEDCGQLWESPTEVDNTMNCPGTLEDVAVYAELGKLDEGGAAKVAGSPERFAADMADNLAERADDSTWYSIESDTGLNIEVVETRYVNQGWTEVWVTGIYAGPDWNFIYLSAIYWDGEGPSNRERALAALRTLDAKLR